MTLKRNGYSHIKVYAIRLTRKVDGKIVWLNAHFDSYGVERRYTVKAMAFSKSPESKQLHRIFDSFKEKMEREGWTGEIAPKWIWYDEDSPYYHSGECF